MTPTSPTKKAKSSWLLYVLIAVLIGILLCAGVITWLTVLRNSGDGPEMDHLNGTESTTSGTGTTKPVELKLTTDGSTTSTTTIAAVTEATSPTTTTTSSESSVTSLEDKEEESTSPTTTSTTTVAVTSSEPEAETTTTTEAPEIVMPVDVASILKEKTEEFKIVEQCSMISALPTSCRPSSESPLLAPEDPSKFRPIHYGLNITIRDVRKPVLEGHLQVFAQTKEQVQAVSLHAAKIHNLEHPNRIHVVNCDSGETICVARVQQIADVVHLELAQSIAANTNLRVDIDGFISADSGPHVYKQIPTAKWRVPQMIGSIFEPSSARHVFPSFDFANQKSTFSLCLNHGPHMAAIANSLINPNTSTPAISCFEKTVPLTAQQLAFVAFEKTNPLFYNTTTLDGAYLPEIEMIFNLNAKNFKQYEWIHSEVTKVMALMSKWSAFSFPLSRLQIVVAPVMAGHSALGVITLPAQAIAYQKHTSTHETLIKEVIGQWMEGVVTSEHTCFEKALITYLEWKINEELQIVKKTRKLEIARIRPRNLNETANELRVIRQAPKAPSNNLCSPRFVEVFYTLDETYGQESVIGMIKVIFDKFAFATATIEDWSNAAETATGRPEAAALIREWFRSTSLTRPVLRAVVSKNAVEFHQLTEENWTIPLEISGSAGVQLAVISEKKQSIPFVSSDYVIVDANRKSHAFVVYDADTYLRLIRCFADSRCPSKEVGGIFADLGAALLANILPKPENQDVAKWKSVFKFMAQQNLVEGTAACCVEHAIREMRKCTYWDIQDVCTKIDFNIVLAAVA